MKCDQCRFWMKNEQQQTGQAGECRARSPQVLLVPVQTLQGQGLGFKSCFPATEGSEWCGEFQQNRGLEAVSLSPSNFRL